MNSKLGQHSLLNHLFVIGAVSRRYKIPSAIWGVAIFALYYLVPTAMCAFEGVLIPANAGQGRFLPPQVAKLAQYVGHHPEVTIPYLRDSTHLMMAVVISIGGAIAIEALNRFDDVYSSIANPELLKVSPDQISRERTRCEKSLNKIRWPITFAVISVLCGAALYIDGKADTRWWGNPAYGRAGLALAITIPLAMFFGMHSLYLLAVAQHSISKLIAKGIHLRPFHPDGSNGFATLGNYLLLLIMLSILCATAAWITLRHGYLGIEDFPGIWLGAIGVVTFIPWIVIQPLLHVTHEIRRAQIAHLSPIEQLLNTVLGETESELGKNKLSDRNTQAMKALRDLHSVASEIYETSVFPFNRRVASVLTIGYALQVLTLVKEVASKFK
ncbi:MAG TPA: hypothetical protein VFB24_05300 [Candidatus Binatia bacterium]|nr:hypothetical protein [Candidatus Binatia bacterium]